MNNNFQRIPVWLAVSIFMLQLPFDSFAQINFTADVDSGCPPLMVKLMNTSTDGVKYNWSINDSIQFDLFDTTITLEESGEYTISLSGLDSIGNMLGSHTEKVYVHKLISPRVGQVLIFRPYSPNMTRFYGTIDYNLEELQCYHNPIPASDGWFSGYQGWGSTPSKPVSNIPDPDLDFYAQSLIGSSPNITVTTCDTNKFIPSSQGMQLNTKYFSSYGCFNYNSYGKSWLTYVNQKGCTYTDTFMIGPERVFQPDTLKIAIINDTIQVLTPPSESGTYYWTYKHAGSMDLTIISPSLESYFIPQEYITISVYFQGETNCYANSNSLSILTENENKSYLIKNNLISIYPQPAQSSLQIHLNTQIPVFIEKLSVRNLMGSLILRMTPMNIANSLDFNVSSLKSGVYLLEVKAGNDQFFKKLIITR